MIHFAIIIDLPYGFWLKCAIFTFLYKLYILKMISTIFSTGFLNTFNLRVFNLVEQSSLRSSLTHRDFYSNGLKTPPYLFTSFSSDSFTFVDVIVYSNAETDKSKIL
jgi:hypothetical protein